MLLISAQGCGFYGLAIATAEMSLAEAARRLPDAHRSNNGEGELVAIIFESEESDTHARIAEAPAGLPPVLTPVVLTDTGNAEEDLAAICEVLEALGA